MSLLCRAFGHRWSPWRTYRVIVTGQASPQLFRVRWCRRCPTSTEESLS